MILASSGGSFLGVVVIFGVVGVWLWVKASGYSSTRCRHCGHDNGRSGAQAQICPACGRNKTMISPKRARKR
jgi:hypothetical protein